MKRLAVILAMSLVLQSVTPVSAMEGGAYAPADIAAQNSAEYAGAEATVSEDKVSEGTVSEGTVSENTVSEDLISEEAVLGTAVSENAVSEGDMPERILYGGEDYTEVISDYEQNATALTAYVQDAYYFSGDGSVSFFVGAAIEEASTDTSIGGSNTVVSDVYYTVGDQTYAVGNLVNPKVYYDTYYKAMTLVIDSFAVEADPDQSRDFKVYFTFDNTKYMLSGSAKFIDERNEKLRVYQVDQPDYFNLKKGSKIQMCVSCLAGYDKQDVISKLELVPYGSDTAVATGVINQDYSYYFSDSVNSRYTTRFQGKDGYYVYLSTEGLPKDTYQISTYADITLTKDLEEGYYDLLYTAKNGVKYRVESRYYATETSHVYRISTGLNDNLTTPVLFQDQGDYIAVYVYGININKNNVPVFYAADGERQVSTCEENDSRCGYEQGDEWGSYFVVKKTEEWIDGESYSVKITDAQMHTDDAAICYYGGAVYLVEITDSYIRAYLPGDVDVLAGEELTWVHSRWDWDKSTYTSVTKTLCEETVTVQENAYGLFVEVESGSEIFEEHFAERKSYTYKVTLMREEEPVVSSELYNIPTIEKVSKITVPSGCTWEIHPITQVAQVLYSGKSTSGSAAVLTNAQMAELFKLGAFRVCIYNADGTLRNRYLAYSAIKDVEKYQITYVLNGGVNNEDNPAAYSKGDTVTLKAPTKEYATFGGWYSDARLTKKTTGITATSSGDKTFYAKWLPYTYTIKFDANGGSGTMKDVSCSYGTPAVLPANGFTKKGYNFVGWSTVQNPDETAGTGYEDKAQIENLVNVDKGSITLYAQWEMASYTITYHTAGSVNAPGNVTSYTIEDAVTFRAPTTTMQGVTFKGWYRENTYKTPIGGIGKGSTGDIHVYAQWVANTYTIAFDVNAPAGAGVSGAAASVKAPYHADVTLPKSKLKCKGCTFAGWSTVKTAVNGEAEYADQATVLNLIAPRDNDGGSVTLYAVWQNRYDIVYHADGGLLDEEAEGYFTAYQYGDTRSLPVPVKAGYTFGGWYKDAGLKSKLSSITRSTQGDLELYAKWTANSYKIIFSGNGSTSGRMAAQTMKYGVEAQLSKNKFVRNGYVFDGWKTEDGISYEDEAVVNDFVPARNKDTITLVAQWKPVVYQITYELDGGVCTADNVPASYQFGDRYVLPDAETVSREGYTFAGWYTDCNYKKKIVEITAKTAGDLTVYAKWTANYKIRFHSGDTQATGSMAPQAMKYETAKSISKNRFLLEKQVDGGTQKFGFSGWAVDEDGEVVYKNGGKIVRPDCLERGTDGELVLDLYAVWDSEYTVTLSYQGAVLGDEEDSSSFRYQYGVGVTKAELAGRMPVRDGYTFAGWYSDPACRKKVTAISAKQTGDMVLYAKWTGVKYTVSFAANGTGVIGKMQNQKMAFGTAKALNKCSFRRPGYTFMGWSTDADGEVVYANREKIAVPDCLDGNNTLTLYAVWEKDTYSITYRNVDASGTESYPHSYQVDSASIVLKEPERMGYTFLGWYTDAACRKGIKEIRTGSTSNLTLYAKWKVNETVGK